MPIRPEKIADVLKNGIRKEMETGADARECPNCYWYQSDGGRSGKIYCLNLGRKDWQPIDENNTCDDFVLPCDFKPDPILSMVIKAVNKKIEN